MSGGLVYEYFNLFNIGKNKCFKHFETKTKKEKKWGKFNEYDERGLFYFISFM